jgi:hypothetical protein
MYAPSTTNGKPALRVIPREPRPWRVAWKEAEARVQQEKAA